MSDSTKSTECDAQRKFLVTLIDYPKLTERTITVYNHTGFEIVEGGCLKIEDDGSSITDHLLFAPTRWLEIAEVPITGKTRGRGGNKRSDTTPASRSISSS